MLKNIFWGIALVLMFSGTSCKKSCGCEHAGACVANSCVCPDPYSGAHCDTMCQLGYEGYRCQTLSKERFLGTWNCTSTDPTGHQISFLIVFSNNPTVGEQMYLTNFNNKAYVVICTMSGKYQFDINDQTSTGSLQVDVNGYSKLSNGKLTLYIEENNVNYFATATMQ